MNILLLSYGNESSIEIAKSINELNEHTVYGCHWDTINAGRAYLNTNFILEISNPFDFDGLSHFLQGLESIIETRAIDLVYVTNCKLLKLIYENYDSLKFVDKLLIPDKDALQYCLYKDRLYEKVPDASPRVFRTTQEALDADIRCVFIKPKYGSSGDGTRISRDLQEIDDLSQEFIACEYLPYDEFTVDCVSDSSGRLRDYNVRVRTRIRDGICNYGRSTRDYYSDIGEILEGITARISLPHHWFAQFKLDENGRPRLLEINCRISGSFCITKSSRKDYVRWLLQGFPDNTIAVGPSYVNHQLTRHMSVHEIKKKSYVVDIDGTLCTETGGNYFSAEPLEKNITLINELYVSGATIILHTARGMKRFNNDIAAVYASLYTVTVDQLARWDVKYDKLIMGKPVGTHVDQDALTIDDLRKVSNNNDE